MPKSVIEELRFLQMQLRACFKEHRNLVGKLNLDPQDEVATLKIQTFQNIILKITQKQIPLTRKYKYDLLKANATAIADSRGRSLDEYLDDRIMTHLNPSEYTKWQTALQHNAHSLEEKRKLNYFALMDLMPSNLIDEFALLRKSDRKRRGTHQPDVFDYTCEPPTQRRRGRPSTGIKIGSASTGSSLGTPTETVSSTVPAVLPEAPVLTRRARLRALANGVQSPNGSFTVARTPLTQSQDALDCGSDRVSVASASSSSAEKNISKEENEIQFCCARCLQILPPSSCTSFLSSTNSNNSLKIRWCARCLERLPKRPRSPIISCFNEIKSEKVDFNNRRHEILSNLDVFAQTNDESVYCTANALDDGASEMPVSADVVNGNDLYDTEPSTTMMNAEDDEEYEETSRDLVQVSQDTYLEKVSDYLNNKTNGQPDRICLAHLEAEQLLLEQNNRALREECNKLAQNQSALDLRRLQIVEELSSQRSQLDMLQHMARTTLRPALELQLTNSASTPDENANLSESLLSRDDDGDGGSGGSNDNDNNDDGEVEKDVNIVVDDNNTPRPSAERPCQF